MSENVTVTAGSGVTIGADQVTINGVSQELQRIKVYDGTNDSTNAMLVNSSGQISAIAAGALAHDAAATGNPVRVGVRARGTLSALTLVSTNDVTEVHADRDGVLLARPIPLATLLTTRVAPTTAAATAFTQLNATTLLRNYITSINVYNNGATSVQVSFLNGTTAANVFYRMGGPIKGFSGMSFNPPLRQPSTNTALGYKISAAIGGAGVDISVTGFQSQL